MMLQLSVKSWDSLELTHLAALHSDMEMAPSGWMTCNAQVVRPV